MVARSQVQLGNEESWKEGGRERVAAQARLRFIRWNHPSTYPAQLYRETRLRKWRSAPERFHLFLANRWIRLLPIRAAGALLIVRSVAVRQPLLMSASPPQHLPLERTH